LRALGGSRETAAAPVGDRDEAAELEAAVALLRRRVPDVPTTLRERDRALGILVRKGYAIEVAHAALRRHAGVLEPD
jgi:regulatory protein